MFRDIVRSDDVLLLLNVVHPMLIAFLPFPTAVLAEALSSGTDQPVAAAFYGGSLALLGILPRWQPPSAPSDSSARSPRRTGLPLVQAAPLIYLVDTYVSSY